MVIISALAVLCTNAECDFDTDSASDTFDGVVPKQKQDPILQREKNGDWLLT